MTGTTDDSPPLGDVFKDVIDLANRAAAGLPAAEIDRLIVGMIAAAEAPDPADVADATTVAAAIRVAAHAEAETIVAAAEQSAAHAQERASRAVREADDYRDRALLQAAGIVRDARHFAERAGLDTGTGTSTSTSTSTGERRRGRMSVRTVDHVLRYLTDRCASAGRPRPELSMVRLGEERIELYAAEPAALPSPFTRLDHRSGAPWVLPLAAWHGLSDPPLRPVPAPYPGLATVAHTADGGYVLINLEHLTTVGVVGPPVHTLEVVTALAVELAVSPWARGLQVTLVGLCPELAQAAPDRVRYCDTVDHLVDELSPRPWAETSAPWPEIVLVGDVLGPGDGDKLAALAADVPGLALVLPDDAGAARLSLDADGRLARLTPGDTVVTPRRLNRTQYEQAVHLVGAVLATSESDLHDVVVGQQPAG